MRTLVLAVGSPEEERLSRYEQLRKRLALPRVEVRGSQNELYLTFEPFPPSLQAPDPALAARAIAWLSVLEREWGEPLGQALHEGELCYDVDRALFLVGPGLIRPSGTSSVLDALGAAVGMVTVAGRISFAQLSFAQLSFAQLAIIASTQDPSLQPLLTGQLTSEDTVRHLRLLSERATGEEAVRYAGWALRVRPHDPALAEHLTRLWLAADLPGEPPSVRAVLEGASTSRTLAGVLLARLAMRRGEFADAQRWTSAALRVSPENLEAVRLQARLAHARGDTEQVMDALSTLARAGDEAALDQLVAQQRWSRVDEALERWPGAPSTAVVRIRLERLYRQESLKSLVLTFLEHLELVRDELLLDHVLEAAVRLGTVSALRENLWRALMQGHGQPSNQELVVFLARICRLSEVYAPIIELGERYPELLPVLWVAEALAMEGQYEALLVFAAPHAELVPLRLQAMIQLELAHPGRFPGSAFLHAARASLATASGEVLLRSIVQKLEAHAPWFGPLPLLTSLL